MTFGEKLRALMAERQISQRRLAAMVPCDNGHLSKVANGVKRPSPELVERLDQLLGADGELIALSAEPPESPGQVPTRRPSSDQVADPAARTPGGQAGSVRLLGPDFAEDELRRRIFLALMGAAAARRLAEEAEPLRLAFNGALTSEPTERDADAWERVAYDYAYEVGLLPAPQLLPELLADFDEIKVLVKQSSGTMRKQLVVSSAKLAALTAITFINLGDPRGARRWWRTAARAADESGNHPLASLMRGRQAVFSLYEPRPNMSILRVAEEAIEIGRGTPCAGVASGYAAKAQALATWGRHDEAKVSLENLKRVFDGLPDSVRDDRSTQWGWSEQRLYHVASHVHTLAGDVKQATEAQDTALTFYPEENYQGRSQIELHRSGCFIRAGDVDTGAQHMVRTLERLPVECSADGLLLRTALSTLALASPKDARRPAIREAYEMLAITTGDR
ncbi:helix-turn-helix transcriptional regulator [Actinomadura miaoliensis]|uniref:HTH cro/C1-type domain-containing protein n=1 Tax=Actinomadura miaoliensis TaxID=430685 RepID=A0ABP7V316_9ACTN